MSDPRALLQQALEFVTSKQWGTTPYMDVRVYEDAARLRDTLRAALKQPEQAPVAWWNPQYGTDSYAFSDEKSDEWRVPLYTHPTRRLTDEVIADLWARNGTYHHHFARAIERWLKGQE